MYSCLIFYLRNTTLNNIHVLHLGIIKFRTQEQSIQNSAKLFKLEETDLKE